MKNIDILDTDMVISAHGAGCAHVKRAKATNPFAEAFTLGAFDTMREVWAEYNEDFIAEAEGLGMPVQEWAHPITFYPCTGMVTKRTDSYRG